MAALLLPPVPLLWLLLLAWWWQRRRPGLSTLLLMVSVVALWFSQCQVTGWALERQLATAPSLSTQRLADLRRSAAGGGTAIVVLGGGVRALAPEYGEAHLEPQSMERVHYGLWLARQVQAPVLFSGGAGWAQPGVSGEATVAGRLASRDYGRNLRWVESESSDTRSNARMSLLLLQKDAVAQVLLVTHGWHMRRAVRAFEEEAARLGMVVRVVPAPMGLVADRNLTALQRWVPSGEGNQRVRQALREWIGLASGA
ncbi:MAG: YdcF family protein [Aquabacterium sp.]|nr:YdcF family protein [Aquabacterium sp.]